MTPRKSRPDIRDRKARLIMEAAAAVFAERGLQSARVADIAERAGIGKGTLYEYFRSKDELFLAVFEAFAADTLEGAVAELEPTANSAESYIRAMVDTVLRALAENIHLYALTMEFWSAAATSDFKDRLLEEFRKLYADYRAIFAETIRDGISAGEFGAHVQPERLAAVLVSAIDGIFLQAWIDPRVDAVQAGNHFLDILLRGMSPERPRAGGSRAPER